MEMYDPNTLVLNIRLQTLRNELCDRIINYNNLNRLNYNTKDVDLDKETIEILDSIIVILKVNE